MDPYPLSHLGHWWNNLDLGAPPASLTVVEVDRLSSQPDETESALAVLTTSRQLELSLEPLSTALVVASLGINLMEVTPPRHEIDGTLNYDGWMESCLQVRDQMRSLIAREDESGIELPTPFDQAEEFIRSRSNDGLATLIDGSAAAAAALAAYGQDASILDHIRFLANSPSPVTTRVAQYLRIPAVVPFEVAYVDATVHRLALAAIDAAVSNVQGSRQALLEDLNPQTEG